MKILKNLLSVLYLIYCPLFLFGQLKHELKIVPLDLFLAYTPSYELILNEKIGVEVDVSFGSRDLILFGGTTVGSNFSSEPFGRRFLISGISGKYYFSTQKYSSGFYIGPHLRFTFNTYIEETFEDAYFERFNTTLPNWGRKGFQSFHAGFNGGYKWLLFKEHLIVEPSFLLTSLYGKGEKGMPGARGFDFDFEIRVGYRF